MSVIDTAIDKANQRADDAIVAANAAIAALANSADAGAWDIGSTPTPMTGSSGGLETGKPLSPKGINELKAGRSTLSEDDASFKDFPAKQVELKQILADLKQSHTDVKNDRDAKKAFVDNPNNFGIGTFSEGSKVSSENAKAASANRQTAEATERQYLSTYNEAKTRHQDAVTEAQKNIAELIVLEDSLADALIQDSVGLAKDPKYAQKNPAIAASVRAKKAEVRRNNLKVEKANRYVEDAHQAWSEARVTGVNKIKRARVGDLDLGQVQFDTKIDGDIPSASDRVVPFMGIRGAKQINGLGTTTDKGYKFHEAAVGEIDPYKVSAYTAISLPTFVDTTYESYFDWTKVDLGTVPYMDFGIAESISQFEYTEYADANLDELKLWVQGVRGRGSILTEKWSDKTFERAKDKEANLYIDLAAGVQREFASRGFRIPQIAAMKAAITGAEKYAAAAGDTVRTLSSKVLEIEAELQKFAVEKSISMEQLIAEISKSVADRALKAAELTFNLQIAEYNVKLELHKAEVDDYVTYEKTQRARLEANLARLEVAKTKISVSEFAIKDKQLGIQTVELAQKAAGLLVEEHKALMAEKQLELAYINSGLEQDKLNLQKFTAVAEVASRKVSDTTSMNKSKVDAFLAEVEALQKLAATRATDIQATAAGIQSEIERIKGEMEEYRTLMAVRLMDIGVDFEDAKVITGLIDAGTNRLQVGTALAVGGAEDATKRDAALKQLFVGQATVDASLAHVAAEKAIAQARTRVDAAAAAAPIAGSMAQAALSSVGAFVSAAKI